MKESTEPRIFVTARHAIRITSTCGTLWSKLVFGLRILKIRIHLKDYVLYHSKKEEKNVLPGLFGCGCSSGTAEYSRKVL